MAFSSTDILEEFVEASRMATDRFVSVDAMLFGKTETFLRLVEERKADPWDASNKRNAQKRRSEDPVRRLLTRERMARYYLEHAEEIKARARAYGKTPEGIASRKKYEATEKRRLAVSRANKKYRQSGKGKIADAKSRARMKK